MIINGCIHKMSLAGASMNGAANYGMVTYIYATFEYSYRFKNNKLLSYLASLLAFQKKERCRECCYKVYRLPPHLSMVLSVSLYVPSAKPFTDSFHHFLQSLFHMMWQLSTPNYIYTVRYQGGSAILHLFNPF